MKTTIMTTMPIVIGIKIKTKPRTVMVNGREEIISRIREVVLISLQEIMIKGHKI